MLLLLQKLLLLLLLFALHFLFCSYRQVWVSGWGTVRAESMAGKTNGCATTPKGPQKFKRCANFKEEEGRVHCKKAGEPPSHEACREFMKQVEKDPVVRH